MFRFYWQRFCNFHWIWLYKFRTWEWIKYAYTQFSTSTILLLQKHILILRWYHLYFPKENGNTSAWKIFLMPLHIIENLSSKTLAETSMEEWRVQTILSRWRCTTNTNKRSSSTNFWVLLFLIFTFQNQKNNLNWGAYSDICT